MIAQFLALVELLREIVQGVKFIAAFVKESQNEQWWRDWTEARTLLRNAKTSEERREAARRIRDSLSGL